MTIWRLVWRSLVYDRRSLTGTLSGAALAAMVLVGALIIGDSVRYTLRRQAELRIGHIDNALITGDRLVRSALADAMSADLKDASLAPVLRLQGVASTVDRTRRALNVALMGVDERFFAMAPVSTSPALKPGEAFINRRLAAQLAINAGDAIVIRVNKPSSLSRDLTLATTDDAVLALRVTISQVIDDEHFGRFSLAANQVPPFNVFVPLDWLGENAEQPGNANLVLEQNTPGSSVTLDDLGAALRAHWHIEDLGLSTRSSAVDHTTEWRSSRVFIDQEIAWAAAAADPDTVGLLTYFVNELRHGEHVTPYSTVTGIGPLESTAELPMSWRTVIPRDLSDDEIIITRWLADDLDATVGDRIEITYFVLDSGRQLREHSAEFSVRGIIEQAGPAADPQLMPDIPGLSDSANCRDWNPGIPINLDRIRDKDETYWDKHRGTPKAFVSLAAAQRLWANRFGQLTALRVPDREPALLSPDSLLQRVWPEDFGLTFQPVRGPALAAANPTTDFGGLFIGLSLFLIVSALLLTGMLFAFTVHQRRKQMGALLAVGWDHSTVRGWLLREAVMVAMIGSFVGSLCAVGYSTVLLAALKSIWQGAVASAALELHITPMTVGMGAAISFIAAMTSMHFAALRLLKQRAMQLLSGESGDDATRLATTGRRQWVLPLATLVCLASGVGCIAWGVTGDQGTAIAAFFSSGSLLLIAGILVSRWGLTRLFAKPADVRFSSTLLALRSAARRPGRSTAAIALLACGCFLVVAVGMNRLQSPTDAGRDSGTGGFALIGELSIPLLADLNSPAARSAANLDETLFKDVSFVPLRVRDGDEASCLNLNRAQQPRVLGVDPRELARRFAMRFGSTVSKTRVGSAWESLLEPDRDKDVIPAIVDQASMMWAMHRSLGDVVEYQDDQGQRVRLRLIATLTNSILQGSLIISEADFEKYFPSEAGHRMLLIDAPPDKADAVGRALTRSFEDIGLQITPAPKRLAEFNAVQNTYMAVFQVLGGLGLIVGTAGLGMVLVRNVSERRGELALLIAIGFTQRDLRRLLLIEHAMLLTLGVAIGVGAAVPAVWPAIRQSASGSTVGVTIVIVAMIALSGSIWVTLATHWAMRGRLIDSLRYE